MKVIFNILGTRNFWLILVGTLLVGTPISILANLLGPSIGVGEQESSARPPLILLIAYLAAATGLGLAFLRMGTLGGILRSSAVELLDENIEVLIIGLSPLMNAQVRKQLCSGPIEFNFSDMARDVRSFETWAKECKSQRPPAPEWQQAWRAINAHRKTLKKVAVVPSAESARDFKLFKKRTLEMLKHVHDLKDLTIELAVPDVYREQHIYTQLNAKLFPDYTQYDQTYRALRFAVRKAGVPSHNICIDYTSGTASFSIAAVALTINTDLRIQYVETKLQRFAEVDAKAPTIIEGGRAHIYKFGLELPNAN